jgi:hypothetical protein
MLGGAYQQKKKKVNELCSKHLSKHFAIRIQRPPIKEGRRGEKRRKRRRSSCSK